MKARENKAVGHEKSEAQELTRRRKNLLETIEKYSKLPYYKRFLPGLERELAIVETSLTSATSREFNTADAKSETSPLRGAAAAVAATPVMDTGQPRYKAKKQGVVVQRLGLVRMKDRWGRLKGWLDITMTVVTTPATNKIQRHIYVNFRPSVKSPREDYIHGVIAFSNMAAFVDNIFRWGPITATGTTGKIKVFHSELWEIHGNHKLKFKRPVVDLFDKQKQTALQESPEAFEEEEKGEEADADGSGHRGVE